MLVKIILCADAWGTGRSFLEYVLQLGVYPAGFLVVGQLDVQHFYQAGTQVGVEYRGDRFDTPVEVAAHPVGGTHEYFRVVVVAEVPDAGVFQKTVDNTGDTDVTTV